ncbi:MAG: hypothetical protein A2855_00025 [Candidatus Liptonbacteria bacterium RIFCSPHIGHO2_01_FULL_57_28]|uniref:Uncharacterized protein n=1 Tax=Candidatus Liptonbacteria bacterium RIFCSPHIGHO2_01_FULL_57_28 TaxID=1798647 RepID=A0A1G2CCE1_9BACT|nr:MAG: hypothetical protein A2855_00025 [Candidatus Liptonbacteria bacterium RIFCSPHIGHO2_01_FULL_57_28]
MTGQTFGKIFFYGCFALAAVFAAAGWLWAWFVLRTIDGPLILHFSDYTGINQIGGLAEIHGVGATGVVIVALNYFLARQLQAGEPRWAKLLAGTTLFLAVLLFAALAAIISVNQ